MSKTKIKETEVSWTFVVIAFICTITFYSYWWQFLDFSIHPEVTFTLTFIAVWSYSVILFHGVRAYYYRFIKFPEIQLQTDFSLKPDIVVGLLTMYEMSQEQLIQSVNALIEEIQRYGVKAHILLAMSKKDRFSREAQMVYSMLEGVHFVEKINIELIPQRGFGKRDILKIGFEILKSYCQKKRILKNFVALVMDGDTILTKDIFSRTIPYLLSSSRCGALTVDNRVVCDGEGQIYTLWNSFMRYLPRVFYLNSTVTVLTGRFALMKGEYLLDSRLHDFVGSDKINHFLFGVIRLLTGDDKSTRHYFHEIGKEVWFIPDVFVYCQETLPVKKIKSTDDVLERSWKHVYNTFNFGIVALIARFSRNMFLGGYREVANGPKRIGWGMWLTYLDQQVGFVRPQLSVSLVLILSHMWGIQVFAGYMFYVLLTRGKALIGLMVLRPQRERDLEYFLKFLFLFPFLALLLWVFQLLTSNVKDFVLWLIDLAKWTRADIKADVQLSRGDYAVRYAGIFSFFVFFITVSYSVALGIGIFF